MSSSPKAHPSFYPQVVIVGGGFAGLQAAKRLGGERCRVMLIDKVNHHVFQPLLYQVASAQLSPADISHPIRSILRRLENVEVTLGEVTKVAPQEKVVILDYGARIKYDFLILAAGARHGYFGHNDWERWAPGLKTLEDAVEIRKRVLLAFEEAEREADEKKREALLTFVLVGGGPTGIEMAGAIAELARHALKSDFRRIYPELAKIILVEAGPRILQSFPESLSEAAQRSLEKLGVQVWCGQQVTAVESDGVTVAGKKVLARNVLWAAGVFASPLGQHIASAVDQAGRVRVEADLSVAGRPEIFVVGDLARVPWEGEKIVPGVAPAAVQMGNHAAANIVRKMAGTATRPFEYFDKGNMATIGRAAAVAEVGSVQVKGYLAWLLWCAIHVFYLIGFRNRLLVMLNWTWNYMTYKRGTRLITGLRSP